MTRAARLGRLAYRAFSALPFWGNPDDAFLFPGPEAGHTGRPITIPCGDHAIPGHWLAPKAGSGAAVLLVHGATTSALAPYMFFMRALVERGIAVMAIELDGHGENPRPFDPACVADNVPAALDALAAMPGVDRRRIGILGVSLGAACAVQGAATRDDVAALAAVGMPLSLDVRRRHQLRELLGIFAPHCAPIAFTIAPKRLFSFLVQPMRVATGAGVVQRHILELETPRVIGEALAHLDPLVHLERLAAVPMLVLTGAWDTIAPVAHAERVQAATPGPSRLAVAPGRNHFTIMTCPFAARTLGDWFAEHLTAAPSIRLKEHA